MEYLNELLAIHYKLTSEFATWGKNADAHNKAEMNGKIDKCARLIEAIKSAPDFISENL